MIRIDQHRGLIQHVLIHRHSSDGKCPTSFLVASRRMENMETPLALCIEAQLFIIFWQFMDNLLSTMPNHANIDEYTTYCGNYAKKESNSVQYGGLHLGEAKHEIVILILHFPLHILAPI